MIESVDRSLRYFYERLLRVRPYQVVKVTPETHFHPYIIEYFPKHSELPRADIIVVVDGVTAQDRDVAESLTAALQKKWKIFRNMFLEGKSAPPMKLRDDTVTLFQAFLMKSPNGKSSAWSRGEARALQGNG